MPVFAAQARLSEGVSMRFPPTPCGGLRIRKRSPHIHWCAASKAEVVLGALAGAQFEPADSWTPGDRFLRVVDYVGSRWRKPYRRHKWAVIRLDTECPYRRASKSSTRARKKGDEARQPAVKRRRRKA
jgi:hypothetical protein